MKKVCVSVLLGLVAVAFSLQTASALPPINKEWTEKYVKGNSNAKFVEAVGTGSKTCSVCHGANKKDRNEYGKAVNKFITKAKYNELKENPDKAKEYIIDGLNKAEAEKDPSGKSYGEIIKAGELPGGK